MVGQWLPEQHAVNFIHGRLRIEMMQDAPTGDDVEAVVGKAQLVGSHDQEVEALRRQSGLPHLLLCVGRIDAEMSMALILAAAACMAAERR